MILSSLKAVSCGIFITLWMICIYLLLIVAFPLGFISIQLRMLVASKITGLCYLGIVFWGRLVANMNVICTGDLLDKKESALIICNHQSMLDILVALDYAHNCSRLSATKFFAKDSLKYVPFWGWGLLLVDFILLKRNWHQDVENIERTFRNYVNSKIPLWLIIYPEGTRIRPAKLCKSQEFAESRNLRIPEHTLIPRPKGFSATIVGMREKLDAVYDMTIAYEGKPTGLSGFAKGQSNKTHLHIRRIPISDLPQTESELARWLQTRYEIKDQMLEKFQNIGHL